ncbi:hypothetical protein E8L90_19445 [Brevibacillus antibioticus]|uniref:Uncharacterized protein n=1 Tax=Brevibacillus antibioticus TaxID=2570228 RepID=A0A4U2YAW3_9BACL|nr:hypothetical protein [Brevibacillus antibioticus]TKI57454.1 hypothetical protein E8L90_19445 [Brevibacillus antibioticus]
MTEKKAIHMDYELFAEELPDIAQFTVTANGVEPSTMGSISTGGCSCAPSSISSSSTLSW